MCVMSVIRCNERLAKVKTLTDEQIISFQPCPVETAATAAKLFESFAPVNSRKPGFLDYAVKEGLCVCEQISFNDAPAFVFWYHKTDDGGLWLNAVQSLHSEGVPFAAALVAVEKLRQREKAQYVRALTIRGDLTRILLANGYKVDGVLLAKE